MRSFVCLLPALSGHSSGALLESSMMNCWLPTVTVNGSSSALQAGGFWSVASVGSRNSMKPSPARAQIS